jgi:hypothetical protein
MDRWCVLGNCESWIFVERHLAAGGFNWLVGTFQMETEPFGFSLGSFCQTPPSRLSHVSRIVDRFVAACAFANRNCISEETLSKILADPPEIPTGN